ncbi:hypothetical protein G6011_03834 [Alternaria panax]|uniref:C3H1-type domain-containing protein n=1 Tax=Alternaria panax TaxID=48097 RepID=A0AAD4IG05_9PLEO|nr:hypothetical protein G6011_03834 [Alternaria panax]
MVHFAATDCARYQTYARPLAGGKRKRASTSNKPKSTERDATSTPTRSKKSRNKKDEYKPKAVLSIQNFSFISESYQYMAGFEQYPVDVMKDWREDLVEMFSHAALRGVIKQDAVARHMIPRLVLIVPRNNGKKIALIKDFANHYENVRRDLMVVDKIMLSDDEDSVAEVCECLYGLHKALAGGQKWRDIIPYTPLPLPLHRLRAFRNLVEYARPYQFLRHLITEIDDIEGWLTFLSASLNIATFSTELVNGVKKTLRDATEDKITRTSIGPTAQEMAEYRKQKAEKQCLEKEGQEYARLQRVQRIEAEQTQMKEKTKSIEANAAKERAQESVKKLAEAAALAEREKLYQDQISRNANDIGKLNTDLINLAGGQVQKTQTAVTSSPSLPLGPGQLNTSMGSSFGSNQTANSSVYQSQSSLGISFDSSVGGCSYGKSGSFEPVSHQPTPEEDGVPMEDIQGNGPPQQHLKNSGPTSLSDPGIRIAGQSNPFGVHISSGVPSQLLGLSNSNFKPVCPAHKIGLCPKDMVVIVSVAMILFFLTEVASRVQPQQSSQVDQMAVDSDPAPRSSAFSQVNSFQRRQQSATHGFQASGPAPAPTSLSQANPFQNGRQNQIHGSQAYNNMNLPDPPSAPRESPSIMSRITKDSHPILSQGPKFASKYGGNVFGQHAPQTGSHGRNALVHRITKDDKPRSTRATMFSFDENENDSGYEAPPASSRECNAFFGRITKNDRPISSQGQALPSIEDDNTFRQRSVLSNSGQGSRDTAASKKVACLNNFKGRCNKGVNCQYAHEPCSHFLKGNCFAEDWCRKSHDPGFLPQGSFSNGGTQVEQSLEEILRTRGGRKEKHGKPPQLRPPTQNQSSQNRLEQSLDDMIQTTGRGRKDNQEKTAQSEIPCRWQKTPAGCTNGSCPYKHDAPKSSDPKASRGTFGIPNLFGSIGNILRGNRQ